MTWEAGEMIMRRDLWGARVWYAVAGIVVADTPGELVVYYPPGSELRAPTVHGVELVEALAAGNWDMQPNQRFNHTLVIVEPEKYFSVLLIWDESWAPLCWYVNVEAPQRRRAQGVDGCDYFLDAVIRPDRQEWHWKDEDHLDAAVALGLIAPRTAEKLYRSADEAIAAISASRSPYGRTWLSWRPDPSWATPCLPRDWGMPGR